MEFVKPFNHITLFIKYDGTTTGSDTIRQDCNIHRIQEKIGVGGWDTVSIAICAVLNYMLILHYSSALSTSVCSNQDTIDIAAHNMIPWCED